MSKGNHFGTVMLDATRQLHGCGNMAGEDYVGKFFASFYDPLARDVIQVSRNLVLELEGVAVGLCATANNFSVADHHSKPGVTGSPKLHRAGAAWRSAATAMTSSPASSTPSSTQRPSTPGR